MNEWKSEMERLINDNEKGGVIIVYTNEKAKLKCEEKFWKLWKKYKLRSMVYVEKINPETNKVDDIELLKTDGDFQDEIGTNPIIVVIDELLANDNIKNIERVQLVIPKIFTYINIHDLPIKKVMFDDGSIFDELESTDNSDSTSTKEDNNDENKDGDNINNPENVNYKHLFRAYKYTQEKDLLNIDIEACLKTNRFKLTSKSSSDVMFTPGSNFVEHDESFITTRIFKSFKELLMGILIQGSEWTFHQYSGNSNISVSEVLTIKDFYGLIYSYKDMVSNHETEHGVNYNDVKEEIDSLFTDVIEKVCKVKKKKVKEVKNEEWKEGWWYCD